MDKNKAVGSVAAFLFLWAATASANEDPWTHFIGSYTCQVGNEVDLSLKRQNPRLRVFNAGQQTLEFSIFVPVIKRDKDGCINGAEEFAKAVRSGRGALILGAKGAMESWCNDRLELKLSKFSIEPTSGGTSYYFTYEFTDQLDLSYEGGLNFHNGNLGDIFHLSGDWGFTYTQRRKGGDLVWFSGQCEQKPL